MRWSDVTTAPTDRTLRQFAALLTAAGLALAVWQGVRGGGSAVLVGAAAVASFGFVGLVRPRWLAPLFVGWMVVAFPVGWLVSTLVLLVLFYGLVTPVALFFRLVGRDALDRRLAPGQNSYWEEKPAAGEPSRYLRQF
jgi:hypothetical protein